MSTPQADADIIRVALKAFSRDRRRSIASRERANELRAAAAAAPDLLGLLTEALQHMSQDPRRNGNLNQRIEAAISRATGA